MANVPTGPLLPAKEWHFVASLGSQPRQVTRMLVWQRGIDGWYACHGVETRGLVLLYKGCIMFDAVMYINVYKVEMTGGIGVVKDNIIYLLSCLVLSEPKA